MKKTILIAFCLFGLLFSFGALAASDGCGLNDCYARSASFGGEFVCSICIHGVVEDLEGLPPSQCTTQNVCDGERIELWEADWENGGGSMRLPTPEYELSDF